MRISTTRRFDKQYAKLKPSVKLRFKARIELFRDNPIDPTLKNHPLSGKYTGYRSINITGDIRALYRQEGRNVVIFAFIGTHSQLYN